MKRLLFILLLSITLVVAEGSSKGEYITRFAKALNEKGWVFVHAHLDGEGNIKYWALPAERLAQSEPWDGSGKVPLDFNKAISIAREQLVKQHPAQDSFPLWSARIQRIECKTYTNRWCYALKFQIVTMNTKLIDSSVLGRIKINGRELDLPDKLQVGRQQYIYPQFYVMLDGNIIEKQSITHESSNQVSETTSPPAQNAVISTSQN